ncbi:DNA polymerase [Kribbella sp. NBC_01505]|uniref:DNA polymerase n=1 Tax=Kribbella sp. NBC_01505 TaxID=2903580 RepID=UPI0038662063
MKTFTHRVSGTECLIHFPETDNDVAGFTEFLARNTNRVLGLDTETTGLHIYGAEFRCRLVQFGSETEAWVLNVERFSLYVRAALADRTKQWVAHNAPFDLLVLDRLGLASLADLGPRVFDTKILAHLCDPRMEHEGGTGLGLKPLSAIYVDQNAEDTQAGLYKIFRSEYKATKETGWALIDIDHPVYVRYAGLDVIYACRLLRELGTLIKGNGLSKLAHWEHRVQLITTAQMKRGLLIDVGYTTNLVGELTAEADKFKDVAARYGVENVNSNAQIIAALQGMGEEWSEKTDGGAPSVGKDVLLPMADLDRDWERIEARDPNPVADAVIRSKRAGKWSKSYAQAMLDRRDSNDRIHPDVKALAARTARMSISNPPLQQLPSGDWTIRRAIIADPGNLIVACDYSQVEMRVLAALSGDPALLAAIRSGEDMHTFTAKLVYAAAWPTMSDSQKARARKLCKAVGFGKVYGGGAVTIAKQTGAPIADVKVAIAAYDKTFPGIKAYGRRLQRAANFGGHEVVTPFGRHLPLDRDRAYAATNYVVQSTARDLLAKALIDIDEAGLSDHILLPVHDELIGQAPIADAKDFVHELGRLMDSTFKGVEITSDPEVYGESWGAGYGCKRDDAGTCRVDTDHPHHYGYAHAA